MNTNLFGNYNYVSNLPEHFHTDFNSLLLGKNTVYEGLKGLLTISSIELRPTWPTLDITIKHTRLVGTCWWRGREIVKTLAQPCDRQ